MVNAEVKDLSCNISGAAIIRSSSEPMLDTQANTFSSNFQFEDKHFIISQNAGFSRSAIHQHSFDASNSTSPDDLPYLAELNFFSPHPGASIQALGLSKLWQGQSASSSDDILFDTSSQQGIREVCASSTQQQFDQATLPDGLVRITDLWKENTAEVVTAKAAGGTSIRRSGRARNATNQRHMKSKRTREDSGRQKNGLEDSNRGAGDSHKNNEKHRKKNRLAAAKCRAKKREVTRNAEDRHRGLSATNSILRKQVEELRDELTCLREHALNHHDCSYQIAQYNIVQARGFGLVSDISLLPLRKDQ